MVICVFYVNTKWGGLQEEHPLKSPMVERFHSTMGDSRFPNDSEYTYRPMHTTDTHLFRPSAHHNWYNSYNSDHTLHAIPDNRELQTPSTHLSWNCSPVCRWMPVSHPLHKNLFGFFRCSECIGNSQTCIVCITIPGNDSIIRITRKIRRIAIIKA